MHTDFTEPGGVDGMRRLLERPVPPDAVVCGNDAIAFVFKIGLFEAGNDARFMLLRCGRDR